MLATLIAAGVFSRCAKIVAQRKLRFSILAYEDRGHSLARDGGGIQSFSSPPVAMAVHVDKARRQCQSVLIADSFTRSGIQMFCHRGNQIAMDANVASKRSLAGPVIDVDVLEQNIGGESADSGRKQKYQEQ